MAEIGRTTDQTNDGNQHNQQGENLSRQVQEMQITGDRNVVARLETTDQSGDRFQVATLGPELAAAQQARFNGLDDHHRQLVIGAADYYASKGVNTKENQAYVQALIKSA